jgi:hypothetical protein
MNLDVETSHFSSEGGAYVQDYQTNLSDIINMGPSGRGCGGGSPVLSAALAAGGKHHACQRYDGAAAA